MKQVNKRIPALIAVLMLVPLAVLHADPETQTSTNYQRQPSAVPRFQSGDRWCVLGDSITHAGFYHRYVELFYLTRFPSLKLDVINCGIACDTAAGAEKRLAWDCLNAKPTVVTVMFGMNDVKRDLYAPTATGADIEQQRASAAAIYDKTMRRLTQTLRDAGAKVVCVLPSPYDDTGDLPTPNLPGCNAALTGLGKQVLAIAQEFQLPIVDFNSPLVSINAEKQKLDPHFTIIGPDRVHPKEPGHLIMAAQFLKAQQLTGVVSRIVIDAAARRSGGLENCVISNLTFQPEGVSFTCSEHSLPFPVTPEAKPALELIPFVQEFDQEVLRVSGLAPGDYQLKIDDQTVRTFTSAELAAGVNLALQTNTPQYQQSLAVQAALSKKWAAVDKIRTLAYVEFSAWPDAPRPVDVARLQPKLEAQLAAAHGKSYEPYIRNKQKAYFDLKPQEADFPAEAEAAVNAARQAAVTKPHQFSLTRVAVAPNLVTLEKTLVVDGTHLIVPVTEQRPADKNHPDFWALRAANEFPLPDGHLDRGIFSIYLLNLLHLKAGEATYQSAGTLHAYLEGVNVELMANSDNVLRGGLTPKHVDVSELMRVLDFTDGKLTIIQQTLASKVETVFSTPATEFQLSRIELFSNAGMRVWHAAGQQNGPDIFIVLNGEMIARSQTTELHLKAGEIMFVPHGVKYSVENSGVTALAFRASIP